MRVLERVGVGAALALLVLGLSLQLLLVPAFTATLARAVDAPGRSGLAEETALDLAEQVRSYVAGSNAGPLPASVDGRHAFGPGAVSHLDDVRDVMVGASRVTWALAVVIGAWLVWRLRGNKREIVRRVLGTAGWVVFATIPLTAFVALLDFDWFFERFHGVFFEEGTWRFSTDDLLIQLFPEPFWMTGAAALGLLVMLGAGALLAMSRALRVDSVRESHAVNG